MSELHAYFSMTLAPRESAERVVTVLRESEKDVTAINIARTTNCFEGGFRCSASAAEALLSTLREFRVVEYVEVTWYTATDEIAVRHRVGNKTRHYATGYGGECDHVLNEAWHHGTILQCVRDLAGQRRLRLSKFPPPHKVGIDFFVNQYRVREGFGDNSRYTHDDWNVVARLINERDRKGDTALTAAIKAGYDQGVLFLLCQRKTSLSNPYPIDVGVPDSSGATPWILALEHANARVLMWMLEKAGDCASSDILRRASAVREELTRLER